MRRGGVLLLLVAFGPVAAVEAQAPADTVLVSGRVVDAETGAVVAGALVSRLGADSATVAVTDAGGRFVLRAPRAPSYGIRIEQLGYEPSVAALPDSLAHGSVPIRLRPRPLELEGIEVEVMGRLAERRRAAAVPVSVVDAARIAELGTGATGKEFLHRVLPLTRLCQHPDGRLCFFRRGEPQPVTICLDERPAWQGAAELDHLRPWEIHSIEVYGSGGAIRVYTRAFMAERRLDPRPFRPLGWCWSGVPGEPDEPEPRRGRPPGG